MKQTQTKKHNEAVHYDYLTTRKEKQGTQVGSQLIESGSHTPFRGMEFIGKCLLRIAFKHTASLSRPLSNGLGATGSGGGMQCRIEGKAHCERARRSVADYKFNVYHNKIWHALFCWRNHNSHSKNIASYKICPQSSLTMHCNVQIPICTTLLQTQSTLETPYLKSAMSGQGTSKDRSTLVLLVKSAWIIPPESSMIFKLW